MCGITGVFSPAETPNSDELEEMNTCLSHRGPDDTGLYTDGPAGLAHQRLSVIDVSDGHQPVFNEDKSVAVVYNGEIYNYNSLRKELTSNGHNFTTESDTEVLVHLYEEVGADLVNKLDGMFAFALWDSDNERLLLARDPMGIKPLVVAEQDGKFAFGSEITSVLASDLTHGGLDKEAVSQYFAFGYIPAPSTIFENITKVEPGELLQITHEGVNRERFYSPSTSEAPASFNIAASQLRDRFTQAVEKRLQSDVPLGAFLSGGIDSSIVVGTMAELSDEPINTFTVGFDQAMYDESWAAAELAEFHGTNHHEFTVAPEDVRNVIPKVLGHLGEPFADPSLIPTYIVARETSRDVKVALSGDGADELFSGYDKYLVEYYSKYFRTLPSPIRHGVRFFLNRLPSSRETPLGNKVFQAQWFANRSVSSDIAERHFDLMRIIERDESRAVRSIDPFTIGKESVKDQHDILPPSFVNDGALAQIQAVDTQYSLPNQMLHKVDLASMYNSLEVRVPFLDTAVVECAQSLPTEYKITSRRRKRVLKHAFEDRLPNSILERGKQGFDMPIGHWLRDNLYNDFKTTVHSVDTGILDDRKILNLLDEHASGANHTQFLWSVYVFKKWAENLEKWGVDLDQ